MEPAARAKLECVSKGMVKERSHRIDPFFVLRRREKCLQLSRVTRVAWLGPKDMPPSMNTQLMLNIQLRLRAIVFMGYALPLGKGPALASILMRGYTPRESSNSSFLDLSKVNRPKRPHVDARDRLERI